MWRRVVCDDDVAQGCVCVCGTFRVHWVRPVCMRASASNNVVPAAVTSTRSRTIIALAAAAGQTYPKLRGTKRALVTSHTDCPGLPGSWPLTLLKIYYLKCSRFFS